MLEKISKERSGNNAIIWTSLEMGEEDGFLIGSESWLQTSKFTIRIIKKNQSISEQEYWTYNQVHSGI